MKYILFLHEQIDVLWLEIDGPNPTGERNIGLDREQQYTLDAGMEESTSCQPHIWLIWRCWLVLTPNQNL